MAINVETESSFSGRASRHSNRIRALRKLRGMTQQELGRRIGCSHAQVSDLERCIVALTHDWMTKIAEALNCAAADLLPDEDNPDRLTVEERDLLQLYRSADIEQREKLARLADIIIPFKPEP